MSRRREHESLETIGALSARADELTLLNKKLTEVIDSKTDEIKQQQRVIDDLRHDYMSQVCRHAFMHVCNMYECMYACMYI